MKFLTSIALVSLSLSALAAPIKIKSDDAKDINIAQVERTITLSSVSGRINVTEIDNGGSTDISSAIYPSQLLLTYFQDGEMNNLQATFNLGPIVSLKSAKLLNKKLVALEVEVKDMQMKSSVKKLTVEISDLVKKAAKPTITVGEFETQNLNAEVILSEKLGE